MDLLDVLLAAVGELLELPRSFELGLGATQPRLAARLGGEPMLLLDGLGERLPGLLCKLEYLVLGLAGAVADRAREPRAAGARPRVSDRWTAVRLALIVTAGLRPSRASAQTPSAANPESVG